MEKKGYNQRKFFKVFCYVFFRVSVLGYVRLTFFTPIFHMALSVLEALDRFKQ